MAELILPACLAIATIVGEASAEPFEGQVAVGKVIRNRMRLRYNSDGTVAGTVLRPYQFSLWNTSDSGRIRVCKIDTESNEYVTAKAAWEESAKAVPGLEEATLYHASYLPAFPGWVKRVREVKRIGRHIFYVDPEAL